MAVVHHAELLDIIVDGGKSANRLQRRSMERFLTLVDDKKVQAVVIANWIGGSVKDLCTLVERFKRRGVALISVAESLDTSSAASAWC
jgi:DNA invertase Pin-like site-specific DNA recombinase